MSTRRNGLRILTKALISANIFLSIKLLISALIFEMNLRYLRRFLSFSMSIQIILEYIIEWINYALRFGAPLLVVYALPDIFILRTSLRSTCCILSFGIKTRNNIDVTSKRLPRPIRYRRCHKLIWGLLHQIDRWLIRYFSTHIVHIIGLEDWSTLHYMLCCVRQLHDLSVLLWYGLHAGKAFVRKSELHLCPLVRHGADSDATSELLKQLLANAETKPYALCRNEASFGLLRLR